MSQGGFRFSRKIGPCFGLTSRRYQSGETDQPGAISRAGDPGVRVALFEAAHLMMTRVKASSALKSWVASIARRRGAKRAKTARARKIGVLLHRLWIDEALFNPFPSRA
ncbi:transposase [Leisingera thetidis]|uniref:transposase n=1 Tax=Leisingera thetidis TaxID=2930199 RepID=UPI0033138484